MRELGIASRFMSVDGSIDPEFVRLAGQDAAEGSWFTFSPEVDLIPEAGAFVARYESRYGKVGPYSVYGTPPRG
jgi:hypothetical protein